MSNVITIVVINNIERPDIKKNSATFSYRELFLSIRLRIAKKERILLVIKQTVATAENSSISVDCRSLSTLSEVKTIKQRPNRLDEVLSIWADLLFSTLILFYSYTVKVVTSSFAFTGVLYFRTSIGFRCC
jgi:L-asparagine transporter-like permease